MQGIPAKNIANATIVAAMDTTYRLGQAAELLGVSVDTVRRWVDAGLLSAERSEGGQRAILGADLAAFARSNVTHPQLATSARNRFVGIVTDVVRDKVMAKVELVAGPHRIVSLMSREAADELDLVPGVRVVASVKATQVVVELPA
jgi:molybdopterin-binding protein